MQVNFNRPSISSSLFLCGSARTDLYVFVRFHCIIFIDLTVCLGLVAACLDINSIKINFALICRVTLVVWLAMDGWNLLSLRFNEQILFAFSSFLLLLSFVLPSISLNLVFSILFLDFVTFSCCFFLFSFIIFLSSSPHLSGSISEFLVHYFPSHLFH